MMHNILSEINDRMNYFYLQTDGSMNFPNSAEGDLLKMVHKAIKKENEQQDVMIVHHETGDSEFSFKIIMKVGAKDDNISNVTIGDRIRFIIEERNSKFTISEGDYDTLIYGSPEFNSKSDAINWLILHIKGENCAF